VVQDGLEMLRLLNDKRAIGLAILLIHPMRMEDEAQPERKTEECNVVTHGVEAVALVCPVFPTGCDRERLADGFFGVLREAASG
jgi:hypothetical protein